MDDAKTIPPGGKPDNPDGGGKVDLGALKRKRGRPPGSGKKPEIPHAPKPVPTGQGVSDIDAAFLAESVVLLLESGDEIIARTLAQKLAEVCPERGEDFMKLQREVGLNERDKVMLRASVTAIVRKYAILGRFGPEIMLFVFFVQYGYRQVKLARFVAKTVEEAKKKPKTEKQVNGSAIPPPVVSESTRFPDPVGNPGS